MSHDGAAPCDVHPGTDSGTMQFDGLEQESLPLAAGCASSADIGLPDGRADRTGSSLERHATVPEGQHSATSRDMVHHPSSPSSSLPSSPPFSPMSPSRKRHTLMSNLGKELISRAGSTREAFKAFQSDSRGEVTHAQFLEGLASIRVDPDQILVSRRNADSIFRAIDAEGRGCVSMREILSVPENTDDPRHMETAVLWKKCAGGVRKSESDSQARWKPQVKLADAGGARLHELDAQSEHLRLRKGIQRHWEDVRQQPKRQVLPPYDARLHPTCNALIQGKSPEGDETIFCENLQMQRRFQRIRDGLQHCSSARHQIVELQNKLRPMVEPRRASSDIGEDLVKVFRERRVSPGGLPDRLAG